MNIGLKKLLQNDATSGVVLILAAALAMFLANHASTQQDYQVLLAVPVEFRFGSLDISKNLLLWINDALMALFFLMVGLEVKREMVMGALAKREQAVFPLIAALGGMLMPGLLFLVFNRANAAMRSSWAIPTAPDIAFALGSRLR
nr:Heat shock protein J [Candidatus Pantoea persica]